MWISIWLLTMGLDENSSFLTNLPWRDVAVVYLMMGTA